MSLTYDQMKLVKGTLPALREHGEHISTVFYKSMLKDHPELNNYFNAVNMQSGAQPRALTTLILVFASNLSNISEIVPKLERVAQKHTSLGIQPGLYEIVGKYLLRAFAAVLGRAMTPDVRIAWTKAYWTMANMLTSREAQIYKGFEGWTGWRRFVIDRKATETVEGDIVSFTFKPVDGAPLPTFRPGQYISLRVRVPVSAYLQIRQYSLSDAPRPDSYRITLKRVAGKQTGPEGSETGSLSHRSSDASLRSTAVMSYDESSWVGSVERGTKWGEGLVSSLLCNEMQEGDVVELTHPAGEYHLNMEQPSHEPLVLLSAGGGLSPLLSMLIACVEARSPRPISWLQGSRGSFACQDHIRSLESQHQPYLRTQFFDTGVGKDDAAETETTTAAVPRGYGPNYLHSLDVKLLYLDNRLTEYYVCGPEKFMSDVTDHLKSAGVSTDRIRCELHSVGFFEK